MRARRHRHPVLEAAVFAAVLLLAAFVGRELWKRRAAALPPPVAPANEPFMPTAIPAVPVRGAPVESFTERGTSYVPGIRLSRPPKPRRRRTTPPAPTPPRP